MRRLVMAFFGTAAEFSEMAGRYGLMVDKPAKTKASTAATVETETGRTGMAPTRILARNGLQRKPKTVLCSHCGHPTRRPKSIGALRLCNRCHRTQTEFCAVCGGRELKAEMVVCEMCGEYAHPQCGHCDRAGTWFACNDCFEGEMAGREVRDGYYQMAGRV